MRQDKDAVEFWDLTLAQLLSQLQATPEGLSTEDAERRLREYGPNTLVRESRFVRVLQFMRLFANPLVIILFVAAVVSFVLGEHINALIIVVIILLSVILNFVQEYQAARAVRTLRQQVSIYATVIRDGKEQEIPLACLVPGDIVKLNAGDLVPADARLLEAKDLYVRESALTGESLPVEKTATDLGNGSHGLPDAR
ncbi:MAG: HAD-IC family P-type ATPase, partial [Armatimonadota bacterium]